MISLPPSKKCKCWANQRHLAACFILDHRANLLGNAQQWHGRQLPICPCVDNGNLTNHFIISGKGINSQIWIRHVWWRSLSLHGPWGFPSIHLDFPTLHRRVSHQEVFKESLEIRLVLPLLDHALRYLDCCNFSIHLAIGLEEGSSPAWEWNLITWWW